MPPDSKPFRLTPICLADLMDGPPPTDVSIAASLARTAADILDRDGERRIDSATWRLADALAVLADKGDELPGVHERTGRGARLDLRRPPEKRSTQIDFGEPTRQRLLDLLQRERDLDNGPAVPRRMLELQQVRQEIERIRAGLHRFVATEHGWTVGQKPFDLSELTHGRRRRQVSIGASHFPEIDHPDYFREPVRPFRPAAVLSHSYAPKEKIVAFAHVHGLCVEFLPWPWYLPGGCNAALLTKRDQDEDLF